MLNKKKIKQIYLIFLFMLCLFSFFSLYRCNNNELKIQQFTEEDKKYSENFESYNNFQFFYDLWKKQNIKSYHFIFNYIAQAPTKGRWEIFVKDGKVIKIISNTGSIYEGNNLNLKTPFFSFTIDSLFAIASQSYKNNENSLFIITVKYNEDYGYPEQIKKIPIKKDAPIDQSFAFLIIFFEISQN
ncbi:MAG: hypothetical protein GYA61_02525 [Spirochaetales bacterium]|nr:DUF6174 domain-containing protein [Exilispira sp.]NMC67078.1 hypothetical protein [Spirochaetales bacterium]